ncbi:MULTISPECIES: helix-turn-helix domain-containing protein [Bacillus cereus group]|uniref:helix-turn-helix domain-containing protein n=1 Tax=Bacillales TaxID=1385 RepID=UPI000B42E78D|nr:MULTISPECIES: helix-turn-helix transcriptional regulator [Bacillus cereus group]OTW81757.1 transcriptional regulator [Bacillus thuringiensis serovar cameroun]MBJ7987881.1 helix-turn-helix transcriptional regulator [Bacillus cereus]MED1042499.1 helix-turn-helix transcriptional regulator [Bacillus mycoides]MED1287540.1 helix-turn-helix transcriptional regulator [Bacillus mycoides]MED3202271.1 helix-turn-helix transcriptional regulator [Bacillus toyonensis]
MIKLRLSDILRERDMKQKELAELSGLRESTVSDMVRGIRTSVNLDSLEKVMDCLDITDYNEMFEKVEEKMYV